MKKIFCLGVIILLVMTFSLSGCSLVEDVEYFIDEVLDRAADEVDRVTEERDEEEVIAGEGEALFEIEKWVEPENYQEFVATFKKLKYSVGEVDGEKVQVHYSHVGVEDVDGVETDKVELGIEGEGTFTMWIDEEGEFRRLIIDGEEIPSEMAHMLTDSFMNLLMLPFQQVISYNIGDMVTSPVPGVTEKYLGSETAAFGDLTATVHTVEISVKPPAVPEGQSGVATLHIADFGQFQMVTAWNVHEVEGESFSGEFTIDEIVLR